MKESKWQEEPILNWQEKLQLFFALIIFLMLITISTNAKKQQAREEKIQECAQLLNKEQIVNPHEHQH